MKLSIARISYPVTTLGPGNRVGIWTTGCHRNCPGCISPELQTFDERRQLSTSEIVKMVRSVPGTVDGFTISGGEPLLRPEALKELLQELIKISDDIILFTGFTYDELLEKGDADIDSVLTLCSVLIDGPYLRDHHCEIGLRGSDNQSIRVFRHSEKYKDLDTCKRSLQVFVRDGRVITIGIP